MSHTCVHKLGFKFQSGDSEFTFYGIQDSNLNPRKMARIQDSSLVFKGPINHSCAAEKNMEKKLTKREKLITNLPIVT